MEIISFVGTSSAVKRPSPDLNFNFPRIVRKASKNKIRSASLSAASLQRRRAKTESQFVMAGLSQFFYVIFVAALVVIVPCTVFNVLSYFENNKTHLYHAKTPDYEFETLNSAMARFAMDGLSDNVDENGNVLSSDGSVITPASVGVGEAVTFQTYTVKAGDSISTI